MKASRKRAERRVLSPLRYESIPQVPSGALHYAMRIEETVVYVMVQRNGGMTTDQIADAINRQKVHIRKDGKPVTSAQVYAVICRFPEMFTKEAGRILLMI